jgi:hypothetical protein
MNIRFERDDGYGFDLQTAAEFLKAVEKQVGVAGCICLNDLEQSTFYVFIETIRDVYVPEHWASTYDAEGKEAGAHRIAYDRSKEEVPLTDEERDLIQEIGKKFGAYCFDHGWV